MEEALKFTWLNMGMALSYAAFTLLFVIAFHLKWEGRILGITAGGLLFFIIGLIVLKRNNLFGGVSEIKKDHQQAAIKFGLPLIPHLLAVILIDTSDKVFIANKLGTYEVGLYNMGYKFGALILLLQNVFINVWNPFLYKRLQNADDTGKNEIVRQAWFFFMLIFGAAFIITLISPFCFDHFIDERYKDGVQFVFWVALGYCFYSIFNMLGSIILYFKKTAALSYISAANVVVNVILNYYLIDIFGTMGAAYATFISFFAVCLCGFIYVNSLTRLPWLRLSLLFQK
jgi:O-antigen/teichoic acid export membrane protein